MISIPWTFSILLPLSIIAWASTFPNSIIRNSGRLQGRSTTSRQSLLIDNERDTSRLGLIDELNEHRRCRLTLINLRTIEPARLVSMSAIEKSAQTTDHAAVAAANALRLHAHYRGKIATIPKVQLSGANELAIWYTPGVAEPCRAIAADLEAPFSDTNRGNTVAIVSDGSRVLGLGDIGPEALCETPTPVWSAWAEGRHDRRRRVCLRQQTTATGWRRRLPAVQFNRSRRDAGVLDRLGQPSDRETVFFFFLKKKKKKKKKNSTRGARNSIPEHSETYSLSPSAANSAMLIK